MTLLEFIDTIAQQALQHPRAYNKPGHNGPYHDPETPVRNRGHWLITFSKLYEWTGNEAYKSKAAEFAEYIISKEARPYGYSFYHRNAPNKDQCNGLVGQAWTFEALIQANQTFQDNTFIKLAEEVSLQHHFNKKHGLWNILQIDGNISPIDVAFNHQLWFAASLSLLVANGAKSEQSKLLKQRVQTFLDNIPVNLKVLDNGLLYHKMLVPFDDRFSKKTTFKTKIKEVYKDLGQFSRSGQPKADKGKDPDKILYKSVGYHSFNMYAFALLKQNFSDHQIWESDQFKKMVHYMQSEEYEKELAGNQYGYYYNISGFEIPYAVYVLTNQKKEHLLDLCEKWVNLQIAYTYDLKAKQFAGDGIDQATLTARIYELTRLPQDILKSINIK